MHAVFYLFLFPVLFCFVFLFFFGGGGGGRVILDINTLDTARHGIFTTLANFPSTRESLDPAKIN